MKTMNFILAVLLALGFTACGSGSSGSAGGGTGGSSLASSSAKNLFSTWTENGTGFVLDMTGGSFGTFNFTYLMSDLDLCDCTLDVSGSQSSGNAIMSACSYQQGTGDGVDPGCASLDASYTYTKTGTVLDVCDGNSCNSYQ